MRRRRCDVARRSETGKEDPDVQRQRKSQRLEEESSLSSSSSSESVRSASTREADLVEKSRKHPGCLLKSALKERDEPVSFSSARGGDQKPGRREGGILPSPSGLPAVSKGRPEITARTSDGSALDVVLEGDPGRASDLLVPRLKAVESSLAADGNWSKARHMELIPGQACLSTKAELDEASKAELRAQRLRAQMQKTSK